jgi:hypothetical protein
MSLAIALAAVAAVALVSPPSASAQDGARTTGPGGQPPVGMIPPAAPVTPPGTTPPAQPGRYPAPTPPVPGPTSPAPMVPPKPAAASVTVVESDPLLAVLGVGTMEAEAVLKGFGAMDVVGRTWPPGSDGEPDTHIQLKLSAPGLILDWIEVRSAPDPTELIWTTNGAAGTLPIGLVRGTRFLNDASGSVSGLQVEDFVVLSLYIQDDGFLERLEQPGTITITYRGGDVVTVPIEPLRR